MQLGTSGLFAKCYQFGAKHTPNVTLCFVRSLLSVPLITMVTRQKGRQRRCVRPLFGRCDLGVVLP